MNLKKNQNSLTRKSKNKDIQLSEHFGYKKLLKFAYPSIAMMIFMSVYSIIDGFFVSNFVGKTAFSAINFIFPFLMILGAVGLMFGTGGSALVAKIMGEGDTEKANKVFSLIVYAAIILGVIIAAAGLIFLRPIAVLMGAEGELLKNCVIYGRIYLVALPFNVLQLMFQCLFATAEKPKLGLYITAASGIANIILDTLFVAVLPWGLSGAAAATAISQVVGGIVPIIYFAQKNSSKLRLTRCRFDGKVLFKTCTNGSSEFVTQISASIVGILFNFQLMKYAGEDGIAAYGVLMYVGMIFQAVFFGYTLGSAPVISYHFGAENKKELKSLRKKSLVIVCVFSLLMFIAGQLLSKPFSLLFVGYDKELLNITVKAFGIYSFSFLLSGISIFASSFFTALNDGLTSALISFLRTIVFQCSMIVIFPLLWQLDGIWYSIVVAEVMAALVAVLFLIGKQKNTAINKKPPMQEAFCKFLN
ncbi:MATE family efflux transporter [Eubacteriales bacterium OttesenSCG-928-G02]|nr:MATE family efflux transporter [Eubacteriales bacterium OttesenSCG-928-G02]